MSSSREDVSDGVDAPGGIECAKVVGVEAPLRGRAYMNEVSIIGLDLAKNVFQAHGAGADGSVVFRRKLSRAQLLKFMGEQPPYIVAVEAWFVERFYQSISCPRSRWISISC